MVSNTAAQSAFSRRSAVVAPGQRFVVAMRLRACTTTKGVTGCESRFSGTACARNESFFEFFLFVKSVFNVFSMVFFRRRPACFFVRQWPDFSVVGALRFSAPPIGPTTTPVPGLDFYNFHSIRVVYLVFFVQYILADDFNAILTLYALYSIQY